MSSIGGEREAHMITYFNIFMHILIGARGFLCDISQPRRMMDGGLAGFQNSSAGGGGGGVHLMDMWGAPPPTPPESRLLPQPP